MPTMYSNISPCAMFSFHILCPPGVLLNRNVSGLWAPLCTWRKMSRAAKLCSSVTGRPRFLTSLSACVLEITLHLLTALESHRASSFSLCVFIVPKEFAQETIPGLERAQSETTLKSTNQNSRSNNMNQVLHSFQRNFQALHLIWCSSKVPRGGRACLSLILQSRPKLGGGSPEQRCSLLIHKPSLWPCFWKTRKENELFPSCVKGSVDPGGRPQVWVSQLAAECV
jgi:hypothetical protein